MATRSIAALVVLLLLPLGVASADAGPTCEAAAPSEPGTYSGAISASDPADWYAVDVPAGYTARATINITSGSNWVFDLRDDCGQAAPGQWLVYGRDFETSALPSGVFRVGVSIDTIAPSPFTYTLTILLIPHPDPVVFGLTVTEDADETLGKSPTKRTITYSIRNDGSGVVDTTATVSVWTNFDEVTTVIDSFALVLDPGESRDFETAWDGMETGTVGDAVVTVSAPAAGSLTSRSTASVTTFTFVGGTREGATVGGTASPVCVLTTLRQACVTVHARPSGVWAREEAGTASIAREAVSVNANLSESPSVEYCYGLGDKPCGPPDADDLVPRQEGDPSFYADMCDPITMRRGTICVDVDPNLDWIVEGNTSILITRPTQTSIFVRVVVDGFAVQAP